MLDERQKLIRVARRALNRSLSRAFESWLSLLDERDEAARQQRVMGAVVRRFMLRGVSLALNQWTALWKERQRLKILGRRLGAECVHADATLQPQHTSTTSPPPPLSPDLDPCPSLLQRRCHTGMEPVALPSGGGAVPAGPAWALPKRRPHARAQHVAQLHGRASSDAQLYPERCGTAHPPR